MGRFLLNLIALAAVGALFFYWAPREEMQGDPTFDDTQIGDDVQAYIAAAEARFETIRPGLNKQIIWAGDAGKKTALSVVYVHGYSASLQEVRPLPDDIAKALGANLFYTRLTGHGQDGAALAKATAGDWQRDMAEALALGRALGQEVLVIGTSTGATLAALAALNAEQMAQVKGVVLISPNFGIKNPLSVLLRFPLARQWLPLIAGQERGFAPQNAAHEQYWTTSYPSVALFQMAALVAHGAAQDYGQAQVPALFVISDEDQVIRADLARKAAAQWGAEVFQVLPAEGIDPFNHVLAGDVLSPNGTAPTVEAILNWVAAN